MIGKFVTSKAGHDKGQIYIVLSQDEQYVYLTDGVLKTVQAPKKKSKKHVQPINRMYDVNETVTNEGIKRAIKLYRRSICQKLM